MVYNKAILRQIYGAKIDDIPVLIFTDSKNLCKSVNSSKLVDDSWLITDIATIKDALLDGTVTSFKRVKGENMLANCLTKFGASSDKLLDVLHMVYLSFLLVRMKQNLAICEMHFER